MKKYLLIITALSIVFSTCSGCSKKDKEEKDSTNIKQESVEYETYTTMLVPCNDVKLYPEATGRVEECNVEEGDFVQEGDLLIKIDGGNLDDNIASVNNSISKCNLSIASAQENVNNLKIYAASSGILKDFTIKKGERVNMTTIGKIVNQSDFCARVPFTKSQIESIKIGAKATIVSDELMSDIQGTVTKIYSENNTSVPGSIMRDVEISGTNPGGLFENMSVSAIINGMESPTYGIISEGNSVALVSKGSGNAIVVNAKEGDYVKRGQLIVELENESTTATLQRAKLDLNDQQRKLNSYLKDLENLKIISPMTGIITECKKAEHDSIATKSDSVITISDITTLNGEFLFNDEDYKTVKINDILSLKLEDGSYVDAVVTDKGDNNSVIISIDNVLEILPNTTVSFSYGKEK